MRGGARQHHAFLHEFLKESQMHLPFHSKTVRLAVYLILGAIGALPAAEALVQSAIRSHTVVENINIDASAPSHPFQHFWEKMFGSGRAILTLREGYRNDLRAVKEITGFEYVRFHAIFHDETGIYDEDEHGVSVYNFAYIDQIYDGLIENNVRHLCEITIIPKKCTTDSLALTHFR